MSNEHEVKECACLCGKGKFKVFYRTADKGQEGIEHLWEINCIKCRSLYSIQKRGKLIGVIKKEDLKTWEAKKAKLSEAKSKTTLHKPKFIKTIHRL